MWISSASKFLGRMGNEGSKESAVAARHNRREEVPTEDAETFMNEATNAGDMPAAGTERSPRSIDSPEGAGTKPKIPTQPSGFPRQRDHYSPPRRRSISPPPLRNAIATGRPSHSQEREGRFNGTSVQHSSSPSRPHHAHSPRSPIQHWSSPTRRRSSPARRPSSSSFQDRSRPANGPAVDEPLVEDTTIRNLVWQAPGYHRRVSSDAVPEKIVFNGLTGVPTGPKNMPNKQSDQPTDATLARSSPHIFISHSDCKTLPTSRKHLAKCLKVSERDVHREPEHGWRIIFEDSAEGRSRLERCYEQFHLHTLFSMYVLKMHCFPNGIKDDMSVDGLQEDRDIFSDANPQQNAASDPRDNGTTISANESLQVPGSQSAAVPAPSAQQSQVSSIKGSGPADASCSTGANGAKFGRSSPVVTRIDRDDSSSVSAPTTSDTSASKGSKCHVCRTPSLSGLELMAHCSTCPRKYHRRCLPKDAAPVGDLRGWTSWQCQRCVKKQVPARSRLSNGSFSAGSPAPLTDPHSDAAASITKQGDNDGKAHIPADAEVASSATAAQTIPTLPDRALGHSSEADDLVEMMFADTSKHQQPKKTGRLELKRTKIAPGRDASGELPEMPTLHPRSHLAVDSEHPKEKRRLEEDNDDEAPRKKTAYARILEGAGRHSIENGAKFHEPTPLPSAPNGHDKEIAAASDFEEHASQPPVPKQKLKFRPIPPHLRKVSGESSVPKKKPHKWAGTGAEKGIIENGFKTLVDPHKTYENGVEQSPAERVQDDERPRSVQGAILDESNPAVPLTSVGPAQDATNGQGTRNFPAPAAKRQKLANAATRPCAKCQRTIALNPSGSNLYCVRCKKEMREDASTSVLLGAAAASPASGTPDTNAKVTNGGVEDTDEPDLDELTALLLQGDDINDATSEPPSGKLKKVDQRVACDTCRINHKRCDHRPDGLLSAKNSEMGPTKETDVYAVQQTPTKKSKRRLEADEQTEMGKAAVSAGPESDDDDSSSEDQADPARKKAITRRSFRTAAESEYDLGDGFQRPKNTYPKLVFMALYSADGCRMTRKQIVQWIADNIPNYNLGEGTGWEGGIGATVSQYRWKPKEEKQICQKPYWYQHPIDPANRMKGSYVELIPGVEDDMPSWDPVLKTPVSPIKLNQFTRTSAAHDSAIGKKRRPKAARQLDSKDEVPTSARKGEPSTPGRLSRLQAEGDDIDMQDAGAEPAIEESRFAPAARDVPDSSDDEPLFRRRQSQHAAFSGDEDEPIMTTRQRLLATSNGASNQTADEMVSATSGLVDTEMDNVPALQDYFSDASQSPKSDASPVRTPIQANLHLSTGRTALLRPSLAQTIRRDAENIDYSASSLFEEWPEYDPAVRELDKAAKIASIQARPRRKQRFRTPLARDPWADPRPAFSSKATADNDGRSPASFDRLTRSPNKMQRTLDTWQYENGEATVIECDTWEEFFDLPTNPIPILHDGQLAYREGLQNEDGTLRRAKVIFKTGYA